ncbi:RidA family protein [bacterium]|nr:RidA family protein [bacterium]
MAQIVNPASLMKPSGFNHGVLMPPGRMLFVAGQAPTDGSGQVVDGDFVAQFAQALRNIATVVHEAGGSVEHIGRLTIYATDLSEYHASLEPLGRAYREVFGKHFPAVAMVQVAALVDEGARVEIEATAVIPDSSAGMMR